MYQELYLNAKLKNDTPENIIKLLKYMAGDMSIEDLPITSDALFKTDKWEYMLQSDSYRFDLAARSTIDYSPTDDCYFLRISCSLNNTERLIEKFLGFVNHYIDKQLNEFLGYIREENSNTPIILKKM